MGGAKGDVHATRLCALCTRRTIFPGGYGLEVARNGQAPLAKETLPVTGEVPDRALATPTPPPPATALVTGHGVHPGPETGRRHPVDSPTGRNRAHGGTCPSLGACR